MKYPHVRIRLRGPTVAGVVAFSALVFSAVLGAIAAELRFLPAFAAALLAALAVPGYRLSKRASVPAALRFASIGLGRYLDRHRRNVLAVIASLLGGPIVLETPTVVLVIAIVLGLSATVWRFTDWAPEAPIRIAWRRVARPVITVLALAASLAAGLLVARLPLEKSPVVWALAVSVLIAAPLVVAIRAKEFDLFEPIWPVLFFSWVQLPGQALYLALVSNYELGLLPLRTWIPLINTALISAIGGTLALLAGYYLFKPAAGRCAAVLPRFESRPSGRRLLVVVTVFTIVGAVAYAIMMGSASGLADFLANLQHHNVAFRGRYQLYFTIQLTIVASLLLFALGPRTRLWAIITALHGLFVLLLIFSLGGRGLALSIIEMALVVFNFGVRPIRVRWVVGFAAIAMVLLVLVGTYRSYTGERTSLQKAGVVDRQDPLAEQLVDSLHPRHFADELFQYDYSSLDMYVLLIDRMPQQFGFAWGETVFDLAYRFVPRALVGDKPFPFNTQINQKLFGAERTGKKASMIGEGFYNLYFPGVLLAMFVLGFFARAVYSYLKAGAQTLGVVAVYAVLYKWIWSLTGGGFSEITLYSLVLFVPLLIGLGFVHASDRAADRF